MTEVYLGQPPKHVKDWIIAHHSGYGLDKPLRFTAAEAGVSVCLNRMLYDIIDNTTEDSNDTKLINLQYSLNGGSWSEYTLGMTINLDENSYVEFKALGSNETISKSSSNYYQFTIDKKVNTSGNIQSLLVEDGFKDKIDVPAYCYNFMFSGCTSLQTAPYLPATTLASGCYFNMFSGCTSIQTAPQLPATTLASSCYYNMFSGCTSLQTAPDLPATTLTGSCYYYMFNGCTSLQTAPDLPATTLTDQCYASMFFNCPSLQTAPQLPATTLAPYCYQGMFSGCTSLQTAPDLPATTLAGSCYFNMFYRCTSLQTAPQLPATTLARSCYSNMFNGCKKFDSVNMKKSMEGVYSTSTHGNTTKTVNYVLD